MFKKLSFAIMLSSGLASQSIIASVDLARALKEEKIYVVFGCIEGMIDISPTTPLEEKATLMSAIQKLREQTFHFNTVTKRITYASLADSLQITINRTYDEFARENTENPKTLLFGCGHGYHPYYTIKNWLTGITDEMHGDFKYLLAPPEGPCSAHHSGQKFSSHYTINIDEKVGADMLAAFGEHRWGDHFPAGSFNAICFEGFGRPFNDYDKSTIQRALQIGGFLIMVKCKTDWLDWQNDYDAIIEPDRINDILSKLDLGHIDPDWYHILQLKDKIFG